MSEEARDLQLFHHGVKGMRWGVRRKVGPDGLTASEIAVRARADRDE